MKSELSLDKDGTERWFLNGEFHRENGPAYLEPDGYEQWLIHDQLHRLDGPAIYDPKYNVHKNTIYDILNNISYKERE